MSKAHKPRKDQKVITYNLKRKQTSLDEKLRKREEEKKKTYNLK